MVSWVFVGASILCLLGALQERKDMMRLVGFLAVGIVFAVVTVMTWGAFD